MKKTKYLSLFVLGFIFYSCGNNSEEINAGFSLDFTQKNYTFQFQDTLKVSLTNKNRREIDSVVYFLNDKKLDNSAPAEKFEHILNLKKLGNQTFSAEIHSEGDIIKLQKEIKILSNKKPVTYTYEVIAAYPHDNQSYTQGLEFYNDTLYESTGQYGRSSLRKVDFKTGEVLMMHELSNIYFAEGLTILNDKIYQLTWREGQGFIYDLKTFENIGSFSYHNSKEGWGLCNSGEKIYKSDGTEKIWILNAETLAEEDFIQVVTHASVVTKMNELEWVEGKIYANTYQKDGVAIINPETGAIEGLIDFRGLRKKLGNEKELDPLNDVLNGIAYNPKTKKLYVTGKDWDTLFEVEVKEK